MQQILLNRYHRSDQKYLSQLFTNEMKFFLCEKFDRKLILFYVILHNLITSVMICFQKLNSILFALNVKLNII